MIEVKDRINPGLKYDRVVLRFISERLSLFIAYMDFQGEIAHQVME